MDVDVLVLFYASGNIKVMTVCLLNHVWYVAGCDFYAAPYISFCMQLLDNYLQLRALHVIKINQIMLAQVLNTYH